MKTFLISVFCTFVLAAAAIVFTGTSAATPSAPKAAATVKINIMNGEESGHGSAVHLGKGRYLTAAHVAMQNAELAITDDQGRTDVATLLWRNTDYDLAILKGPVAPRAAELTCRLANVGEEVHAAGNPGPFEFTTQWGRIAAKPQSLGPWRDVVPVDITIGGGMSGGPVLDVANNIVGVTVGMIIPFKPQIVRTFMFMVPSRVVCDMLARN